MSNLQVGDRVKTVIANADGTSFPFGTEFTVTNVPEDRVYVVEYGEESSGRLWFFSNCNIEKVGAPGGTNPKDRLGAKKPRLSLVPDSGVIYEALAMANGAEKYGPYNWRKNKVVASIYIEACRRHLAQWFDGEENAADSGVPHLGHAKACLGILIDALTTGNLVDDRPAPGASSKLIDQHTKK